MCVVSATATEKVYNPHIRHTQLDIVAICPRCSAAAPSTASAHSHKGALARQHCQCTQRGAGVVGGWNKLGALLCLRWYFAAAGPLASTLCCCLCRTSRPAQRGAVEQEGLGRGGNCSCACAGAVLLLIHSGTVVLPLGPTALPVHRIAVGPRSWDEDGAAAVPEPALCSLSSAAAWLCWFSCPAAVLTRAQGSLCPAALSTRGAAEGMGCWDTKGGTQLCLRWHFVTGKLAEAQQGRVFCWV